MVSGIDSGGTRHVRYGPLTVCKICRHRVFEVDSRVWVRTPAPGIAHSTCVAGAGKP